MENENTNGEEAAQPVAQPAPVATPVTEDVKKTEENKEQFVPYSRFKEVNDGLKATRDELATTAAEMARIREAFVGPKQDEPFLDADAQKALDAYLTKQGFVRQADLEKDNVAAQAARDLAELKTSKALSDEDFERVRAQAVKMGAANKDGLEAAYTMLFMDKIVEDKLKAALADKKPAASTSTSTSTPEAPGRFSSKDALKNRIKSAAANIK